MSSPDRRGLDRVAALRADPAAAADPAILRAPRWFAARLAPAALPWSPDAVWTATFAGLTTTVACAAVLAGPAAGVLVVAATAGAVATVLRALAGREASLVDRSLPDAIEATARGLRSGASMHLALGEAAAAVPPVLGRTLERLVADADAGEPLVRSIDRWSATTPGDGVRLAAAALALAAELGGGTARALDHVAATLRDRAAVRREIRALSSQAQASAVVIGVAPVAFAALAAATDPTILDFLTHSPMGLACLAGGLALDGAGAWWMHRVATVAV